MASGRPSRAYDRVVERRRAVALSRHFRDAEGLSIAQIAERLGRSSATIKAYFYDPTGEKARAVKARYVGVCRGCGAYTQPRNGKGDAYAYCKRCHLGAIERRWTRYYGRFYRSRLYLLLLRVSFWLRRWAGRKYKRLRTYKRFKRWWTGLLQRQPPPIRPLAMGSRILTADEKSPVTGDCHAGIRRSRGCNSPGPHDNRQTRTVRA
jgi:hypothetical protein